MRNQLPILHKKIFFIFGLLLVFRVQISAQELGIAAIYSDKFQGKKTFSGELYDVGKMTAAHKTLPMGSIVRITRLDNKKSVEVKINDKGPYVKGRVVDLSKKAAFLLGLKVESLGMVKVKVELIKRGGLAAPKIEMPVVENPRLKKESERTIMQKDLNAPAAKKNDVLKARGIKEQQPKPKLFIVDGKNFKDFDLYKIQVMRPDKVGYGLQVANFSDYENVMRQIADLQEDFFKNILVSVEKGKKSKTTNYKVLLGPFPDAATAASYKENAKKKKLNGFVVNLKTLKYE